MTRQVRELHRNARETGARPPRLTGPATECSEPRIDDFRGGRTGRLTGLMVLGLTRQLDLQLERCRQQLVLAPKMRIECPLRNPRSGSDLINIDASEAFSAKLT